MEPCRQEPRLSHLEGELAQTVKEIRADQKESKQLLIDIARQTERLSSLESTTARHEKAIEELFRRARETDRLPGAVAMRVLLLFATVGSSAVSGLLVWMITKG